MNTAFQPYRLDEVELAKVSLVRCDENKTMQKLYYGRSVKVIKDC